MSRRDFVSFVSRGFLANSIAGRSVWGSGLPAQKFRPSINSWCHRAVPFSEALAMIRDFGFDSVSVADPKYSGYGTAQGNETIARLLSRYKLSVDWIHAPFPEGDKLFSLDDAERQESIRQCQLAIDAAKAWGVPAVTVHLIPYGIPAGENREMMIANGRESIKVLEEYADSNGVVVALENGQKHDYDEVLVDFLDDFTSDAIGLTYDSGHENIKQPGFRILEKYASRLKILHLHDNEGQRDTHQLPYEGTIDWAKFREVISGVSGYHGCMGLEVNTKNSRFANDFKLFLLEARERMERMFQA